MSFSSEKSKRFWLAARDDDLQAVKILSVDPEVDLGWKDRIGRNAFNCACDAGLADVVRYLLDFNQRTIKYNSRDKNGHSPLSSASYSGHQGVVEMLMEDERIDVNLTGLDGCTPLWWASYWGYLEVVKVILASSRQIDIAKKDRAGRTAVDVARLGPTNNPIEDDETIAAFMAREERFKAIELLLVSFEKDPQKVKNQLRIELRGETTFLSFLWSHNNFLSSF
jgi:hypothetical protein